VDMNKAKESYGMITGLPSNQIQWFTTRVLAALRSLVSREWNHHQASGSIYGAICALAGKSLEPIHINDVWDHMSMWIKKVLNCQANLAQAEDELRRFAWDMRMEKQEDESSPGGTNAGDR